MRFRLGLVTGFAAGYYLGAKAGRQRYEQINRQLGRLKRSEAFEEVTEKVSEKAKTSFEGVAEKAKTVVESRTGNGQGDAQATPDLIVPGPPVQAAEPVADPNPGSTEPPKGLGGYSSSR
jgi:hypothetical protein